ncbi:hypothetical protein D9Q98_001122 [Chlorella vulgaris]|uniref:shikimate dehydrogenase (NADP(+)) n=1 Tax=Chlorella vulgaris TaxID=3077 RepID=A0A9D4TZL7_CHLVU|nr:hypothetical protein D9Q98_001122 [Chlorella vulgaris]
MESEQAASERGGGTGGNAPRTQLCTSLVASTVQGMLAEAKEAVQKGADIVEIRLDYLQQLDPEKDVPSLLHLCPLPAIITYRPVWEGGKYDGPEAERLATLRLAALSGAAYVDVELKVAPLFFAVGGDPLPPTTKVIVSSHDYEQTASEEELQELVERIHATGADIVKFATMANDITDAYRVLSVLRRCPVPCIALAMGERGQITRLLAPKYGGFLTFGALSPDRVSAPGQPTLQQLSSLYGLKEQGRNTAVLGIVGNPVSHSKSPAIHNAALQAVGLDAVYVPLLVDDMASFLSTFTDLDWVGLSVTIPHKQAALQGASEVDPVAQQIGAVNTLVRQADGGLKGYNTDWSAAITAIERGLRPGLKAATDAATSPLSGKTVVVVGAGGAGRALAFGAAAKGAKVVIANRSVQKAADLAAQLDPPASACSLDELASGAVKGDVLVNTTSVGMQPQVDDTPVPAAALAGYELVFDAVYTPLHTRLLREAAEAGCKVVTGDTMFVGQAEDQFRLFTGVEPPKGLMSRVVLDSL